MGNEKLLSNIGLILGVAGVTVTVIPFTGIYPFFGRLNNSVFSILAGIIGYMIVYNQKKKIDDDVVKGGLVVNSISVIIGLISLIAYTLR